jgi:hypothetical protein
MSPMNNFKVVTIIVALVLLTSTSLLAQREAPAVLQAMQDAANRIVALVNDQDAAGLEAMTAEGAPYLDEDGHAPPVTAWIGRITGGDVPKELAISHMSDQVMGKTGWVSFNYTINETFENESVALSGTASVVLQKSGGNWMIQMVHGALEQHVRAVAAQD